MSKFKSENFSRVTCEDCGETTTIEPGQVYVGLNCKCDDVETTEGLDTEISTPVQEELDYVKTQTVIVIGTFENGDYEICNNNDLSDTWRVPKDTFEATYEVKQDVESTTNGKETERDPTTYTITLGDLVGLTVDEIKEKFTMDELRVLAKALKIRGISNMGEDKLVGKLLDKVE